MWGDVAKEAVLLLAVAPRAKQGQQLLARTVQVREGPRAPMPPCVVW
jgi:hypothetical protein